MSFLSWLASQSPNPYLNPRSSRSRAALGLSKAPLPYAPEFSSWNTQGASEPTNPDPTFGFELAQSHGDDMDSLEDRDNTALTLTAAFWSIASIAGTGLGAYHGYARNSSIPWAIGWGILGGLAPIIVIPVAYAQGFGKKA